MKAKQNKPNTPKLPEDVENILDLVREYGSNRGSGGHNLAGYLTHLYIKESFEEVINALVALKDGHKQELQKAEDRAKIEGKIETEEEWKQAFIMTRQERNARNADNSIRLLKEKLESLKKGTK